MTTLQEALDNRQAAHEILHTALQGLNCLDIEQAFATNGYGDMRPRRVKFLHAQTRNDGAVQYVYECTWTADDPDDPPYTANAYVSYNKDIIFAEC